MDQEAFDRLEVRLAQTEKMLEVYKQRCSELETVVIKVRNCVTPRSQRKSSAEMRDD